MTVLRRIAVLGGVLVALGLGGLHTHGGSAATTPGTATTASAAPAEAIMPMADIGWD
jgi:hypothetical protein